MKRPFQHKHKVHISVKNQQNINLVHIHTIAQCDSFAKILQEEQHQIKTKVKIHENWLNSPVYMQCKFSLRISSLFNVVVPLDCLYLQCATVYNSYQNVD